MLARKSILIMGSRIIMSVMGFISLYFITQEIKQGYVGSVAYAISVLSIIGIFTDLGYSQAHIKKVSEGKDLGKCIGTYLTIKAVLMGGFIIVTLAGIWVMRHVLNMGFETSYTENVIYIMLIWSVISGFTVVVTNTFIGLQEMAKTQIVLVISSFIQTLATIYVALFQPAVYLYALVWPIGAAVNLIAGAYLIRKVRIKKPSWSFFKDYTKFALPLMLVVGIGPLALHIDKTMIGYFWSNDDTAVYWVAQRYIQLPDTLTQSVSVVLFPAFSEMIARGSKDTIRWATLNAERYLSMVVFPASFILMAVSSPLFTIFTNVQYEGAAIVFSILMGWVILRALNRPYLVHFAAFGKTKYSLYQTLLFLPINIILNIIFIPDSIFGIKMLGMAGVGAALASLGGVMIGFIVGRFLSRRLIKIPLNTSVFRHIVAAAIPSLLLFLFRTRVMELTRWFHVIGAIIVGGIIYMVILHLVGEFSKKEWNMLMEVIDVRKMIDYIKEELFHR